MLAPETVENAADSIGVVDAPEGLSAIHRRGCAAAIWQRHPLPDFQRWINSLDPEQLPRSRVILPSQKVRETVFQICETCGTPDCSERDRLVDDAAALADIFTHLIPASYLQLRFDVIDNNACRKFHTDAVTARLVCTYRGTGTQYGISTDGSDPLRVFTVPTGAPILLRGTLWPEAPQAGLVHRSPPIAGTGETRLLLVLDPVSEPDSPPKREVLH